MAKSLEFEYELPYRNLPPYLKRVPALEINLIHWGKEKRILCALDTGADHCFISRQIGEVLGIDVLSGTRVPISTGAGLGRTIITYRHLIQKIAVSVGTGSEISFDNFEIHFAEEDLGREILGVNFFQYFKVCFWERAGLLYLQCED